MDSKFTICSLNCRGLGEEKKRRDLFHYLRSQNYSFYFLQETHFQTNLEERIRSEWGSGIYFSSFTSNSKGVAILINNNVEYKIMEEIKDINGQLLLLHIKMFDKEFLLGNIYGPNNDSPNFFEELQENIEKVGIIDNLILAGDWNLVQNFEIDCDNYRRQNNIEACRKVNDMITTLDLVDIWRARNLDKRRYTWRRTNPFQQSRLDYFLVSDLLVPIISDADIKTGYRTDHSLVTLTIEFDKDENRKQFWKFNASLLSDIDYVQQINELIEQIINEYAAFPYNRTYIKDIPLEDLTLTISDQTFLDFLLMKIRSKTISYSSIKKKKLEEKEKRLMKEIEKLENNEIDENSYILIENKKEELVSIREIRMKGVLIRSKARWVEDGEKISSYFCNLEKRNYTNKRITKLTNHDETQITDKIEILNAVKSFYEKLYEKREVENIEINELVSNIPKIEQNRAQQLEGKLTLEELSFSLKNMPNGKSPGSDGFSAEFFKMFWQRLGPLVLRSLNEGFAKGELSNSQKEGVIICIPKSDDNRDKIKNWRPISLLNIVYKLGSASIANRMKAVLPDLISLDQTGFLSNRYIGDNIRLIYDVIDHLNSSDLPGILLILDFEKAFDSLDWSFLQKTLAAFGFMNDICNWIKIFYTKIKSTISVNGQISNWFDISRGCRQGDPISPYLFILCVEIMSIMIKENNKIKGIVINNEESKITQYADDSEILLDGNRDSFEETFVTIDKFSKASGLRLNVSKTNAVWLGSQRNSTVKFMPHLDIKWNPSKFKILGIWFTNDLVNCIELNFDEKFFEIKKLYSIWLKRNITPLGRIAILKSVILSKLVFLWILLPNPPDDIVDRIQLSIFKFIWKGKNDRINRKTSMKSVENGGLGIPNIRCYIQSLKLTWIRKLSNTQHKWKDILYAKYPRLRLLDKIGPNFSTEILNDFWKDVMYAYQSFGSKLKVEKVEDFLSEPIFYNKNVLINNHYINRESWVLKGIFTIKDLINDTGGYLTFLEFCIKYNLQREDFLYYSGCILAIKAYQRKLKITIDSDSNPAERNLLNQKIFQTVKGSKMYYQLFIETKENPNFCQKWDEKLNREMQWKYVFKKVYCIREIRLKWFQVRLMTRVLGTNIALYGMGIRNNNLCTFCLEERETIEHLFTECNVTWMFLTSLKTKLIELNIVDRNFNFKDEMLLFGTMDKEVLDVFEYILIVLRYYIYKCRCEDSFPSLEVFRNYLKNKYEIEKHIAQKNNILTKFNIDWAEWMDFVYEN